MNGIIQCQTGRSCKICDLELSFPRHGSGRVLWDFTPCSPAEPVTLDAQRMAWTVFADWKAGIMTSNLTQRMDVWIVCLYSEFVFFLCM
jgi:hypothetical protein